MTIPFTPSESDPQPETGAADGLVAGAAMSALNARTEANVRGLLQSQLQTDFVWGQLWDGFWELVTTPFRWLADILEKLFPGLPWEEILTLDIIGVAQWITDQVSEVPFLGDLARWVTGSLIGTGETLELWFSNLGSFLGHLNFLSPDFDLLAAAEDFINFILFPVGAIADMVGLDELGDAIRNIGAGITGFLSDSIEGTVETVTQWFGNLGEFFASINFLSPDFDILNAAESFIDFILFPVGKIADMVGLEGLGDAIRNIGAGITGFLSSSVEGTVETLTEWFGNLGSFFASINFLSPDFDLVAAAEDFIDFILFPVGKIADMVGLNGLGDAIRNIGAGITGFLSESIEGTVETVGEWFGNLKDFFASINFLSPDFDLLDAAENFIDFILFPVGKIADMVGLNGLGDAIRNIGAGITGFLSDSIQGTVDTVGEWFGNLGSFFASINFLSPEFDLLAAAESFIDFILFPVGKIADMLSLNNLGEIITELLTNLLNFPGLVIGNIFNVIADGIQTIGDFFNGVWNTLTGNSLQETKISQVNSALGMLNSTSNTAASNALTAQEMADIAGQTAGVALTQAEVGNNLVRSKIASGDNFATNPGFDQDGIFLGTAGRVVRSDESPRTATHSAKVTPVNGSYTFVYPVAVNDGHLKVPCSSDDVFYFEYWCKGLSGNQATPNSSMWLQSTVSRADLPDVNVAAGFGALNASHNDQYSLVYGTLSVPEGAYAATFYLVFPDDIPTGNTYYIDDVRLLRVTEAEAAKLLANTAQAQANTATTNAELADGKAESALGMLGELIQNLLEVPGQVLGSIFNAVIDGIQTVGEWLGGMWSAFMGVVNPGPKTSVEVAAAASAVKSDTDTNAANVVVAQAAAEVADSKAVVAQGATEKFVGPNLLTNYGFEDTNFVNADLLSTEQAFDGTRSLKVVCLPSGNTYRSDFQAGPQSSRIDFSVEPDDHFYFEMMVYPASGNSSGNFLRVYIRCDDLGGNQVASPGVAFYNSSLAKGQWNKISGYLSVGDTPTAVKGRLSIAFVGEENNVYYFDNAKLYRVTEAQAAKGAAAVAQADANTGISNAATADAKAVAAAADAADAEGKAVAADDKAQLANDIHVGRSAGPNIVLSPNFEDDSVQRIIIGSPTDSYYTTSLPYSGTRCFFLRHDGGGGWNGFYLSPSPGNGYGGAARFRIPVNPGEVYQARIWCRPDAVNDYSAGTVVLYLRWRENMDGGGYTDNYTSIGATTNMIPGQWQELEVTGTCPANRCALEVICVATGTTPAGNAFRFDNASVREIRNASEAQISADLAQADANTADANAATADAKAVAAQQAADDADYKAALAKSILKSVVESGDNICVNPSFENTDFALTNANNQYSTTVARSGSRSMRLEGTGGYVSQGLVGDESSSGLYVPAAGTDVWWVQFYVLRHTGGNNAGVVGINFRCRDEDGNLAGHRSLNVAANTLPYQEWVEVSGFVQAASGTVDFNPYLQLWNSVPAGIAYHFDDVKIIRATEAYEAQLEAEEAAAEAATAKSNAEIADGKAVVAQQVLAGKSTGSNLIFNPNFEDTGVAIRLYGSPTLTYVDNYVYSGAYCLFLEKSAAATEGFWLAPLPNDYPGTLAERIRYPVNPGEIYQSKIWIRPVGGNDTAGSVGIIMRFRDGSDGTSYSDVSQYWANSNLTQSSWQPLELAGECPDGYDTLEVMVLTSSTTSPGNKYRFDNSSLREITNAKAAQDAVDTASAVLAERIRSGVNMVLGGGFEEPSIWASPTGGGVREVSDDLSRSGSNSYKFGPLNGATTYVYVTADGTGEASETIWPTSEGRTYYCEFWVYSPGSNTGTTGHIRINGRFLNSDTGATTFPFTSTTYMSDLQRNTWVKIHGFITNPGNYDLWGWYVRIDSTTNQNDVYYIDDVYSVDVTEAYQALEDAETAQGRADTAYTNAETADGKAVLATNALKDVAKSNLVYSPNFEDTSVQRTMLGGPENVFYSTLSRTGERSFCFTRSNAGGWQGFYLGTLPDNFKQSEAAEVIRIPVNPGDIYEARIWVRPDTGNDVTAGSVGLILRWRDVWSGGNVTDTSYYLANSEMTPGWWQELVVSGECPSNRTFLDVLVITNSSCPAGNVYRFDNASVREITKAQGAQDSADTADSKAVVAQDMSVDLVDRQNMVFSPNFEDSSVGRFLIGTPDTVEYRTDAVYSGTQCLYFKYGTIGSGWQGIYLTKLPTGYPGSNSVYSCKPGETYEARLFVRPDNQNNQNAGGYTRLSIRFRTSSTGGGDYWYVNDLHYDDVTAKATWHEFKVVGTCPDHVSSVDGKRFSYFDVLFITSDVATGNIYRLDNASVREITNAQVAQDSADTAQNRADTAYSNAGTADTKAVLAREAIDLKAKDFGNLLAGSDFETAAHGWALPASGFGTGYVLSSSQANTGSKSLKLENPGSNYSRLNYTGTSNPNDAPAFFETKPGEQFLMECYAQRSGDYTNTGGDPRLRLIREAGDANVGWTIDDIRFPAANFPASYTWYKFSKIITIPDDNTTLVSVAWQSPPPGMVGSIWVDDIVLRRIINPALVNGLPNDISVEDTLIQHSAEISDLKAAREVTVNQGKTISVNFTTMSNASSLPTTGSQRWSTRYWGSGSGAFGIVNGKAAWNSNSGSRSAQVIYLGDGTTGSEKTLTDYQTLRGVLVNPPINSPFTAIARANGTSFNNGQNPTYYVWAEAVATVGFGISVTGSLGAVINGTSMNWVTGIPLTWSTEMTLKCGVDGDPRRYQVFSGTTLVMDYKEDTRTIISGTGNQVRPSGAALSGLGSGYRRWGAIARYDGFANSGTVSSVTVSDDPPVIYAGSVARMSRSGTGNTGTIDTTLRAIPNNFFDDVDFESLDIDGNTSDGTFTVSKSKMYAISARVLLSSYTDANSFLGLQIYNGSSWTLTQYGPTMWGADTGAGAIAPTSGFALYGSFLQYLEAGEKVRLVYKQDRGSRTNILTGGGGTEGPETYFTISGMG